MPKSNNQITPDASSSVFYDGYLQTEDAFAGAGKTEA